MLKWLGSVCIGALLGLLPGLLIVFWRHYPPVDHDIVVMILEFMVCIGAILVSTLYLLRHRKVLFSIFIVLTVLVASLIAYALLNPPPQCTWQSTPAEIQASGCIIGADIGTGMAIFFLVFIWGVAALIFSLIGRRASHHIKPPNRPVQP